jgi:thymidylate kinase
VTLGVVILESWWFRPRDLAFVAEGVARSGARSTVEIWCSVPPEVAMERYRARGRHAVHEDERRLREDWPRWAAEAEPLGIGPTIVVETDRQVIATHLIQAITQAIGGV